MIVCGLLTEKILTSLDNGTIIKSFIVFACISIQATHTMMSQNVITVDEVKQAGLCVLEITTINGEEPKGSIIESKWQPGTYNITYDNKVPCQLVISKNQHLLYDSGPYQKKSSGATIRINGNTTAYYSDPLNMPYKLKLEKAADMLCRGNDEKYGDKHWRLLKDATSLNTIVGLKVSELIGLEWTAAFTPCNVIINGDYRGCYLLVETVKRNNNCRISCNKETGCIIERDPYWWKEHKYFSSPWYSDESMYRWTWKYPDEDELSEDTELYMSLFIDGMEQSLGNGKYNEYIDIESWVRWLLAHDVLGTRDSGGANMYLKKEDQTNNSVLEMPCLWDFDSNYEVNPGSFSKLHTSSHAYFNSLFNSENKAFAKKYVETWNEIKDDLVSQLTQYINDYATSEESTALDISRNLNNRRWHALYGNVDQDVRKTLEWLNKHIEPLNNNIQLIQKTYSDINKTYNDNEYKKKYFNIEGMNVSVPRIGSIVILTDDRGYKARKVISNK